MKWELFQSPAAKPLPTVATSLGGEPPGGGAAALWNGAECHLGENRNDRITREKEKAGRRLQKRNAESESEREAVGGLDGFVCADELCDGRGR